MDICKNCFINNSPIHGKGVFVNNNIRNNTKLGPGIIFALGIFPKITEGFGTMINHSYSPNTKLKYDYKTNSYIITTIKNVKKNKEITLNYNNTPWFIKDAEDYYK